MLKSYSVPIFVLFRSKKVDTQKTIGIIGCGWLGLPLAKNLIAQGYAVHGSTTRNQKLNDLKTAGISPFKIELMQEDILGDIDTFLSGCETLIINIPPKLKQEDNSYVKRMRNLLVQIESSTITNVLFIGSTSVYDDTTPFSEITESSKTGSTAKALQLLLVENLFQQSTHFDATILRFAGLFGEDRHPATYLSGRIGLKNPDGPVNLIHRKDCIGIINEILKQQIWNEVLNASTSPHPTRKTYYSRICHELEIPLPEFQIGTSSIGKTINTNKLVRLLNYNFQVKL